MRTYTVKVSAPGYLEERFEQLLGVLPAACMEGASNWGDGQVTLWFDVNAPTGDVAIERATRDILLHLRDAPTSGIDVSLTRSKDVPGRLPWWQEMARKVIRL